jgi:hypothetical protein
MTVHVSSSAQSYEKQPLRKWSPTQILAAVTCDENQTFKDPLAIFHKHDKYRIYLKLKIQCGGQDNYK